MKRTVFLSLVMLLLGVAGWAQPDDGRILNIQELRQAKEYTSMEEALEHPMKVYKLNLKHQKIKKLDPRIKEFKNLQSLNLENNKLKRLPEEIGHLKKLQWLSLYGNKLKVLPPQMRAFQNLQTLFLGKNKLTELPVWVGGYKKLRRMDLHRNRITEREYEGIKMRLPNCKVTI